VLARGALERGSEAGLGSRVVAGLSALEQEVALPPQQLRDDPSLLGAPGATDGLVDQREPLRDLAGLAEPAGQLAQERGVVQVERGRRQLPERGA